MRGVNPRHTSEFLKPTTKIAAPIVVCGIEIATLKKIATNQ
jgi:hypothetical protein